MFKIHRTFDLCTGVKNATVAVFNDDRTGDVAVIYHKTCVLRLRGDSIELRDGGWNTVSTAIVINTALSQLGWFSRFRVERKKHVRYLVDSKTGVRQEWIEGVATLEYGKAFKAVASA